MSAPTAESYDLKKGQLFNLLLVTFASTVGFWAWTIVGPLAKYYAKPDQMHLNPGTTSLLVAMPIFIGAIGRIPIGGLTDKYGGRIMMSLVLAVSAPLVLLVGVAGSMKSVPPDVGLLIPAGYRRYRVRGGYSVQLRLVPARS